MDSCPRCRSRNVVGFTLTPTGRPLRFTHCRSCEHRWWTDVEGRAALRLPDVLEQIGGHAA